MSSLEHDRELRKLKARCYSKVGHKSMLSAQYALDLMVRLPNSNRFNIYPCPNCKLLHIGKLSDYFIKKAKNENKNDTKSIRGNSHSSNDDNNRYINIPIKAEESGDS